MAAINKIEYIFDSQNGIAKAGETIFINEQNAKIVKADAEAGVTEELTAQQSELIDKETSTDETSYDGESTDGEITDEMMNEEGQEPQKQQASAGVASAAAGMAFGALTLSATAGMCAAMNTFTAPIIGAVDYELGLMSIANVDIFDTEFGARQAEFANAEADISTMLESEEELSTNIEELETEKAEELKEAPKIVQKNIKAAAATKAPIAKAPVGDKVKAAVKAPISDIKQAAIVAPAVEDTKAMTAAPETEDAKGIETIAATEITNELEGVSDTESAIEEVKTSEEELVSATDTTSSVAEFLSEGSIIGVLGVENTVMLAASAVCSGVLAGLAWLGVNPFTIQNSIMGTVLCGVAAGLFSTASALMANKASKELEFGAKGFEMMDAAAEAEAATSETVDTESAENEAEVTADSGSITGVATVDNGSASASAPSSTGEAVAAGGAVASFTPSIAGNTFAAASSPVSGFSGAVASFSGGGSSGGDSGAAA